MKFAKVFDTHRGQFLAYVHANSDGEPEIVLAICVDSDPFESAVLRCQYPTTCKALQMFEEIDQKLAEKTADELARMVREAVQ